MGGLFGKSPPPPPPIQPPAPMPDDRSPFVLNARRQATANAMARGGRQSTILTTAEDRPDSYGGTKLGGA